MHVDLVVKIITDKISLRKNTMRRKVRMVRENRIMTTKVVLGH